jgi:hypothetical protein
MGKGGGTGTRGSRNNKDNKDNQDGTNHTRNQAKLNTFSVLPNSSLEQQTGPFPRPFVGFHKVREVAWV